MLAWYRRMKRDEEFWRREGLLLIVHDRAKNYRRELTMHFRSFFRLLPEGLYYSLLGTLIQASHVPGVQRLLKRKAFVDPPGDIAVETPNYIIISRKILLPTLSHGNLALQ